MVLCNFFYTFYESYFFPGQTPVPPRSWLWILDLSHDPFWAIWLAEVTKSHQHHDRISESMAPWFTDAYMLHPALIVDIASYKQRVIILHGTFSIAFSGEITFILTKFHWSLSKNQLKISHHLFKITRSVYPLIPFQEGYQCIFFCTHILFV